MRRSHRFRYAAALAAVGLVTSAGAASAHHCYKEEWSAAAYQNLAEKGTAWMSLSDVGTTFMVAPEDVARCGPAVDRAVAEWMAAAGLTTEPLIHSRATVGGGAMHHKGKAPKPFAYLSEDDFGTVVGLSMAYLAEAGCPVPELG